MIDKSTRTELLMLARAAADARVRRHAPPPVPADCVLEAFGVFVTIHHRTDLRGCLGALDCRERIVHTVARLAAAVTHEDYRFAPLTIAELPHTTIDLSLLTPPERVLDPFTIEVGRHGLIVEQSGRRGLLLPQVAPEHHWDRETFLDHTCIKAGLPRAAWRRGATLYCFEAEVFSEARTHALE